MNLSQLEALVAIVETGSFTDAAVRIGLTRSALSHALANLEAELGVALLERGRGNIAPTTIGNCILRYARDILSNVETIQQEAAAARGLQAGKLSIGIVSSLAASIVAGILRKFRHEYPDIYMVTFEGTGSEVEDWILNGIVDVGFVVRETAGIESVFIGRDEVRVVVPKDHPLRGQRSVTLDQVTRESFIMPKIACDSFDSTQPAVRQLTLQKQYEATEVQTLLAMVREGLGTTILPEMLLSNQVEGLHLLSLTPPLRFRFGVGVHSLRSSSPAARIFIQSAQSWAIANGFEYEEAALLTNTDP